MSRVLPTAPGWWWMRRATSSAPPPEAVLVVDVGGTLYVHREAEVDRHRYEWLEPIPAPGEVEALRRQVAELTADLRRIQGIAVARGWDIDRLRADLEVAGVEVSR